MVTSPAGDGRMRASHADRERVVDFLKAAFVQGRLTQDEMDARIGQALAARTRAALAPLTADLPAEPDRAPVPARVPPLNRSAKKAVRFGAGAIGAVILVTSGTAVILGQPVAALFIPVAIVLFAAFPAAFVAGLIALVLKVESRRHNRSRRQLPPGPASSVDDRVCPHPLAAGRARPRPRRPRGSLAVGRAG
jgi:Domain of unknown function (DUF1707)